MDRRFAFTAIVTGDGTTDAFIIGRADEHVPGYTPCPEYGEFKSYDAAKAQADTLNRAVGLSPVDAWTIVASTMRPAQKR